MHKASFSQSIAHLYAQFSVRHARLEKNVQGPYSPTIFQSILWSLFPKNCNFECNTTSDWLNRVV